MSEEKPLTGYAVAAEMLRQSEKLKAQGSFAAPDLLECHFGKLGDVRCGKRSKWVSTFKGKRTNMTWCDEHKPDPSQILSNSFHNVEAL